MEITISTIFIMGLINAVLSISIIVILAIMYNKLIKKNYGIPNLKVSKSEICNIPHDNNISKHNGGEGLSLNDLRPDEGIKKSSVYNPEPNIESIGNGNSEIWIIKPKK